MKREMNEDFVLVGHLQVLDEALSSLYTDRINGQYFLFVRIFEDNDDQTYILSEVNSDIVIDYIDGRVGLSKIFSLNPSYYYKHVSNRVMRKCYFRPIASDEANSKLKDDSLGDIFDIALACNSIRIKSYLRKHV